MMAAIVSNENDFVFANFQKCATKARITYELSVNGAGAKVIIKGVDQNGVAV